MTHNHSDNYISGSCNIGEYEIRRRKRNALLSLILIILFVGSVHVSGLPKIYRLIIFFPASFLILNLIQYLSKFCVLFGWIGAFNFDSKRKVTRIESASYRKKDRNKAITIFLTSLFLGFVIAAIYFYLPL